MGMDRSVFFFKAMGGMVCPGMDSQQKKKKQKQTQPGRSFHVEYSP
jgi:hypothetical protein